jgi:acetyl/propionyl-CoA carboxylase alpha subunit
MKKRVDLNDGERDWRVEIGDDEISVAGVDGPFDVEPIGDGRFRVREGTGSVVGAAVRAGSTVWVTLEGEVFTFHIGLAADDPATTGHDADLLSPPMSATVVRVAVASGAIVKAGDLLVALEAMKMELPIRAPRDGVVTAVHCRQDDLVHPGHVLIEMD